MADCGPSQRGQATVELALALPALALLLGVIVQIALIGGDQIRLWHAAREAARVAVVDPDVDSVRDAAEESGLRGLELRMEPSPGYRVQGQPLHVEVAVHPDSHVPVLGVLFEQLELKASATMRIEEP